MNRAGDALEVAVQRAQSGWEWWIVIGSIIYFLSALIPWAMDGFKVLG